MEEPFKLLPPKRERKPLHIVLTDTTRQGVLFTGADCLPGQQELFDKPPERKPSTTGECQ